jgi:hypothetical protein
MTFTVRPAANEMISFPPFTVVGCAASVRWDENIFAATYVDYFISVFQVPTEYHFWIE